MGHCTKLVRVFTDSLHNLTDSLKKMCSMANYSSKNFPQTIIIVVITIKIVTSTNWVAT